MNVANTFVSSTSLSVNVLRAHGTLIVSSITRSVNSHIWYYCLLSPHNTFTALWCAAVFICLIAIAHSMGQIIKSVGVCLSVYLSVCEHSHGRIPWLIFTKIGTDVKTPKRKNQFIRGQYRTTPSPILPHKTPILGQKVLKTHANIK